LTFAARCVLFLVLKQAMVDRDNAGSAIGGDLLLLTDVLFGWRHRVRDGTLSRRTFRRYDAYPSRRWFAA
jgi:hypothetical protein